MKRLIMTLLALMFVWIFLIRAGEETRNYSGIIRDNSTPATAVIDVLSPKGDLLESVSGSAPNFKSLSSPSKVFEARENSNQPPSAPGKNQQKTHKVDYAAYGYNSYEEMEADVRAQLNIPNHYNIIIVEEVRYGKNGIGIGIIPPNG